MATKKKLKASTATDRISSLTDLLAADASPSSSRRPPSKPPKLSSADAYDRTAWSDLAGQSKKPIKKLTGVQKMYKGANKGVAKRRERDDAMMMLDLKSGRGLDQRVEEDRARKALEAKAKKYAARDFTEEELLNSNVDFASKEWDAHDEAEYAGLDPGHSSDSGSDWGPGPSKPRPQAPLSTSTRAKALDDRFHNPDHGLPTSTNGRTDTDLPTSFGGRATTSHQEDLPTRGEAVREEEEWATFEDEFQREREARVDWLEREGYVESREDGVWRKAPGAGVGHDPQREGGFSWTKSGQELQEHSTAQYGEQSSFPVYEPSADFLSRLRDSTSTSTPTNATNAAGQTHFDPEIEKRQRNAAAYSFSREEGERGRQMERLKRAHEETERRRAERAAAAEAGVEYVPEEGEEADAALVAGAVEKEKGKVVPVQLTEAERAKVERKRLIEAKKEEMARKRAKKAHVVADSSTA